MAVVHEIQCSNCGTPISFNPGEIIATCNCCSFTSVIGTGKLISFEHYMILNKYDLTQSEELARKWIHFSSNILEINLAYLPFWIVPVTAISEYKGVSERVLPPCEGGAPIFNFPLVKKGRIEKKYDWVVLARKAVEFPTSEYDVPLEWKIAYDFRKIESFARLLNSEIEEGEAVELTKQQIGEHHRFLAEQDIDKMTEMKNELIFDNAFYLHAPIWSIVYECRGNRYRMFLEGSTGAVIKSDILMAEFSIF